MTRKRVIGRADGLPWNLPDEYEHFLSLVRGATVLMGRKSWEIFGSDLGESRILVISRSVDALAGAEVFGDLPSALSRAREIGGTLFSAGGARVYRQTLPLAEAMYLSIVKDDYEGDTYFPEFDEDDWQVTRKEDHRLWEFRVYERVHEPAG
jgi:dihydrofolate reductase